MAKVWIPKQWSTTNPPAAGARVFVGSGAGKSAYSTIAAGQTKRILQSNGKGNIFFGNVTIPVPIDPGFQDLLNTVFSSGANGYWYYGGNEGASPIVNKTQRTVTFGNPTSVTTSNRASGLGISRNYPGADSIKRYVGVPIKKIRCDLWTDQGQSAEKTGGYIGFVSKQYGSGSESVITPYSLVWADNSDLDSHTTLGSTAFSGDGRNAIIWY